MQNDKTILKSKFSLVFTTAGLIIALIGITLHILNVRIYDLHYFLYIIGGGTILYGISLFINGKKTGATVSLKKDNINMFFLNNAILLALIAMVVVIMVIEPSFIKIRVLKDILAQSSTRLIIALGIAFTLLIAGTDLSAGRMVGLAAVVSASLMQNSEYANRFFPDLPQIPVIIAVVLAVLACILFGALNGFLVARFDMHPFIGTLAVSVIVYGANSLYVDMEPNNSQPIGGIRKDFSNLGQYNLFGNIPLLIIFALIFTIIIWFVLNKTVFGKNVYAIGGNRQAAIVSGVNVPLTIVGIFVLASALYGVGGVLEAARTAGATNNYGFGYELDAIAACVVGGVSLNGGVGKVRGIVIGVLIFTVISYGLTFININPNWQQIIKGIIIAVAVALDLMKFRKK